MNLTPQPVLAVYGAKAEQSASAKLAGLLESSQRNSRLKILACTRDHALPLKKLMERKYDAYVPQRILKPDWPRKHQEEIPGGVLVCFETEALNLHAVQAAISLLDSVRANLHAANRQTISTSLALICTGKVVATAAMEEERTVFLTHLKRAAAAPATMRLTPTNASPPSSTFAVLFADTDLKPSAPTAVNKLGQELMTLLLEHYHVEIARIKQLKTTTTTQNYRIRARFEFKCAQMYEMRSLPVKAMAHYQQAYQALSLLLTGSNNGSQKDDDVLSAAEFIHYRMGAIRIALQDWKMALVQLRTHITAMSVYSDWEWCSRQHVLFAGLISYSQVNKTAQLDAVERERLNPTYHFSRAAYFAARANSSKALDLYEKLYEHEHKKQRHGREALLLYYIAQARANDDVAGAGRDYQRILALCSSNNNNNSAWRPMQALLAKRMDSCTQQDSCVVPSLSPIIAMYDSQRSAKAKEFMLQHEYSVALVHAVFDPVKHRLLLKSDVVDDLRLASCAGKHLSDQENRFINGYLLLDQFHLPGDASLTVKIHPTGAQWTMPVERVTTKQFEHKLRQIPLATSVRIMSSAPMTITTPPKEISIAGLPQDGACLFIGERFNIVLSSDDDKAQFYCRSDTLHIERVNAQEFSVQVPSNCDEHCALIHLSSDDGGGGTQTKQVQVKWAMKSTAFQAYSQIESMGDFQCIESSNNGLLGTWRAQDRRNVLLSGFAELITLQRGQNQVQFHLTPTPSTLVTAAAPRDNASEVDDDVTCKVKFNHTPFVMLGEEINMSVEIKAKRDTKVSISPTSELDTPGFILCGALQQRHTHAFAGQELQFHYSLVAQSVGPGKLPGVWVETKNGHRKQYSSADSQCLVLSTAPVNI